MFYRWSGTKMIYKAFKILMNNTLIIQIIILTQINNK